MTLNMPEDSNKEGFPTLTPQDPFSTNVNPSKADMIVCVPLKLEIMKYFIGCRSVLGKLSDYDW